MSTLHRRALFIVFFLVAVAIPAVLAISPNMSDASARRELVKPDLPREWRWKAQTVRYEQMFPGRATSY